MSIAVERSRTTGSSGGGAADAIRRFILSERFARRATCSCC